MGYKVITGYNPLQHKSLSTGERVITGALLLIPYLGPVVRQGGKVVREVLGGVVVRGTGRMTEGLLADLLGAIREGFVPGTPPNFRRLPVISFSRALETIPHLAPETRALMQILQDRAPGVIMKPPRGWDIQKTARAAAEIYKETRMEIGVFTKGPLLGFIGRERIRVMKGELRGFYLPGAPVEQMVKKGWTFMHTHFGIFPSDADRVVMQALEKHGMRELIFIRPKGQIERGWRW
jgi:hypothetical protein